MNNESTLSTTLQYHLAEHNGSLFVRIQFFIKWCLKQVHKILFNLTGLLIFRNNEHVPSNIKVYQPSH
jgi:hypothetical protein